MRAVLVAFALLKLGLRLEVGPEYDTNANRAETFLNPPTLPAGTPPLPTPISSFLVQSTVAGNLLWSHRSNFLRLNLSGGGKIFTDTDAAPQDVVVGQAVLEDTLRASDHFLFNLGGDYYDATQWNDCPLVQSGTGLVADTSCHRDFRSGSGHLAATAVLRNFDFTVGGGGRVFDWKPDDDLSFTAGYATVAASAHFASGSAEDPSEWEIAASGRYEWRTFDGPALSGSDDTGSPLSPRRVDSNYVGSIGASYIGPILGGVNYLVDYNNSSSFGQSYLRHVFTAKLAFDLPAKITATTKIQLVFTNYAEPQVLNAGMVVPLSIEDENRDAIVFDLERPIGAGMAVGARYSVYRNGVSNALVEYLRQVVFLGVSYRLR